MYLLIPVLIVLLFVRATNGEWFEGGNWLFTGIPFFYLGHYMHAHSRIITAMKGKEIILILLGYGLAYLEKTMQWHIPYIYAGSIITAAAVLCLCMNYSEIRCPSFLIKLGTQYSLPVLLFHCQIRDTLQLCLSKDTYWFPLLVVTCATVMVLAYRALMNRRKTVRIP